MYSPSNPSSDLAGNILIIEEASLELLPKRLRSTPHARGVQERFGVKPELQILDRNLHGKSFSLLPKTSIEKRGRPDVVHLALLDATSTPLFRLGGIEVFIHTIGGTLIKINRQTRLPRTLERFCGVMAKLLSGNQGPQEVRLFEISEGVDINKLFSRIEVDKVVAFSRLGKRIVLRRFVEEKHKARQAVAWIVGGFPHGHLEPELMNQAGEVVSISSEPLAAHIVAARLCYDLEIALGL